jgi:pyruvate/2-oxoglutarate/acetoin dehydrogenase E1 component
MWIELAADISVVIHHSPCPQLAAPLRRVTVQEVPIPMALAVGQAILPGRRDIEIAARAEVNP